MRAVAWRTIKSFSGRLDRWRRGGFAQCSRLAQAKIAGGEKGGDLLDDGSKRVFSELHVHLLKREADVSAIGRVTSRCRPRSAEPSNAVLLRRPAFYESRSAAILLPGVNRIARKAGYGYPFR